MVLVDHAAEYLSGDGGAPAPGWAPQARARHPGGRAVRCRAAAPPWS